MRLYLVLFLCCTIVHQVVCDPETLSSGPEVVDLSQDTQRSASPEPFIDRLVSLFSGGKTDKAGKLPPNRQPVYQPQSRPQKPANYGPPPRPVRNPRPPPSAGANKPPPNRYQPQPSPSNNLPTYVSPGGKQRGPCFINNLLNWNTLAGSNLDNLDHSNLDNDEW